MYLLNYLERFNHIDISSFVGDYFGTSFENFYYSVDASHAHIKAVLENCVWIVERTVRVCTARTYGSYARLARAIRTHSYALLITRLPLMREFKIGSYDFSMIYLNLISSLNEGK